MRREEVQAEGEVRRGEDGEGFDEDVGDGFVAREVRVELVSVAGEAVWSVSEGCRELKKEPKVWNRWGGGGGSDRANSLTSGAETDSNVSCSGQVIGNVEILIII